LRRVIVIWESILKYVLFNLGRLAKVDHVREPRQESIAIISKCCPVAFGNLLSKWIEGEIANWILIGMEFFSGGINVIVIKLWIMTKP
jgi:hypothetical protein